MRKNARWAAARELVVKENVIGIVIDQAITKRFIFSLSMELDVHVTLFDVACDVIARIGRLCAYVGEYL